MKYLRSILYLVSDKDKKKIPGLIILFLILSFFEVLGIGLIAPYVALITNTESEVLMQVFLFFNLSLEKTSLITFTSIGLLLVFLIKALMIIFINKIIIFFGVAQRVNLSSFLMNAYQSLSYEEFLGRNSSEYIHNIQVLTSKFASVLILLLRTTSDLLIGLSIFALLAWQNFSVLLILLIVIMIFILTYDFWFKDKVKSYGKNANTSSDRMIKELNEGIRGLKEIRVIGRESYFYDRFVNSIRIHGHNSATFQFVASIPRYLLELIMIFFIVSIVVSAILIGGSLNDILPTLALFGVAALRLLPLSNNFLQVILQLRNSENSIDRLFKDVNKFKNNNKEKNLVINSLKLDSFQSLELKNIDFGYNGSEYKSLKNVSIKIQHGESIGIIGKSGSGKTTLIDLLLGLLSPAKGEIYLNNRKISNNQLDLLNGRVAYIPQQIFLLDDSLMSNISLNKKANSDLTKVLEAAKQARLFELISRLPYGLDTKIGESGVRVSGGERQRIALARAIYYDRDVIIMDEATSALDSATEKEIINEINNFKGNKTLIVIAHRLTTLQDCDIIYKLENGEIIASDNYKKMVIDNNNNL
jgi:ATP-binding cassette, subfamily B, bacterial PglK